MRILEVRRAQGRQHQVGNAAQDVFGIGVIDVGQTLFERRQCSGAGRTLLRAGLRIEARQETFDQRTHLRRLLAQAISHVAQAEPGAGLTPVAGIGANDLHFLRPQTGLDHQAIHTAVFGFIVQQ